MKLSSNFRTKLSLLKDLRHDVIIGVAGVVSILGVYIIVSEYKDYKKTEEGLQMRDIVTKAQDTLKTGKDAVTNVSTRVKDTIYGKIKSLLPF